MPATVTIQGAAAVIAEPYGSLILGPITLIGAIQPVTQAAILQMGNNLFPVPAGAVGVIITPPTGNAQALTYKTTAADVGVNIPKATPSIQIFDTTNLPANVIINAAALLTAWTQVVFF